jgi:hypothetical protein
MRRGAAVAIALVAVLTLSVLVSAVAGVRAAPPSSQLAPGHAVRPAASDTIEPVDQYGFYHDNFVVTADGSANVYFDATDSVDGNTTVAINDYNASRDGLTNPVAKLTAHMVTGVNDSWESNIYLPIPLNVIYPGTWNLTIDGTNAGFYSYNFSVQTYSPEIEGNQSIGLPGEPLTASYWVFDDLNDSFYTHLSKVTIKGFYENQAFKVLPLPGTPVTVSTAPTGSWGFTIPLNATWLSYVELDIIANTTGWTESGYTDIDVAELLAPIVTLSSCAGSCYTNHFDSGETVIATATQLMESGYSGYKTTVPSINLAISYENGKSPITPNGTPPTELTTNANGQDQWLFTASTGTGQFSTSGPNSLDVRGVDPYNASADSPYSNVTFTVLKTTTSAPGVEVTFGGAQYYGGDTIFANWTLTGNATVTKGWTGTYWYGYEESYSGDYYSDIELPGGNLTGTSGELKMTAPLGFTGYLELEFVASNATSATVGGDDVSISQPQILLTTNELYYSAGNTVTVTVTTLGSILSSAKLVGLVVDSQGNVYVHGAISGSSLSVTVPTTAPPTYIEWTVFAVSSSGATITNATLYTDLIDGYSLVVGIGTTSSYSDGSYQPGSTIQISYAIAALGYETMPKAWTIEIWPENSWENSGGNVEDFETTSSSGSVGYTIPSNTPNGIQAFWVEAIPSSTYYYDVESTVGINVQSNPSSLGLELGAGSGLTVGWLVLLIIIAVVAIVLFLVIRGASRPKMMKPEGGSGTSSPPPQAWQESTPASTTPPEGASAPPSEGPTPPPGST